MNDTFYYELKENVSNLKSLSKKLYDYVDTILTPNLSVEKEILINMLRTFANQVDITYYYFELVETKIESNDHLDPVIKYFEGLLMVIGNSVDLLIDLISENFDGNDTAYKNLVRYILRLIDCSVNDIQDSVFRFKRESGTDDSEDN